jgi:hypothetical protein
VRDDLGEHPCFPDASCNQLRVLGAEVDNEDGLVAGVHTVSVVRPTVLENFASRA